MIDLAGVRVLEFSVAWAGPLTGRFLADLGAEVIKIEHPTSRGIGVSAGDVGSRPAWQWGTLPDPQIRAGVFPNADPGERWWNRMGLFNKMNRGKQSLCMDVKTDEGRRIFGRLVELSDVVLNNYSPRGAASLGIDHDSLVTINPRIVTVSMSGYGATGPMASHFSWGPILQAHSGFDEATGYAGGGPCRIGVAYPDAVGGVHGAFALLAALWERERTGEAVHVDLSQLETLASLAGDMLLASSVSGEAPVRRGNRSLSSAPQGVYRCAGDDAWVAVTVPDDRAWGRVAALCDRPALRAPELSTVAGRFAAHDAIDAELTVWTSQRDKFSAAEELQAIGVPAAPAMSNADLVEGGHLTDRGFLVTWDQPGSGPLTYPGFPVHFDGRTPELSPAPLLGEHNASILTGLLGYEDSDVRRFEDEGVLATAPPY